MDKMIFQIPAYISRDRSLSGGGRQFTVETQENLNAEMLQRLMSMENKLGWFNFSIEVIEAVDLEPIVNAKIDRSRYDNAKTPSQRLRSVLWLIHEKKGGKEKDFNNYYDGVMEELITKYKIKLDELN